MSPVAITADETVIVRLQFGPQASGKSVVLTASPGLAINPAEEVFVLRATTDLALSIRSRQGFSRGAISFYCEGIITTLPFTQVSPTARQTSGASGQGAASR
jgi:hypothetical protein